MKMRIFDQPIRPVKEVEEALKKAREMKPTTPAGLWAQQDAIQALERELMAAYELERARTGTKEVNEFNQLTVLPVSCVS